MSIKKIIQKIDSIAPNPWYVDGVKQAKPTSQLMLLLGIIFGLVICYYLS